MLQRPSVRLTCSCATLFLLHCVSLAIAQEPAERAAGKYALRSFNHEGVRLPGMQYEQLQQVRDYYMRLQPNDILRGFRLKDRKWAPGKELGGAYSERPLSFGQWLGGFARLAKSTGDAEVRQSDPPVSLPAPG